MNTAAINRREFLGSAAAAGSLVVGFSVPVGAQAQGGAPEINAWVVVQPDERVIVRIARSEMGQGTLTGLAQLVSEELDCDWARVSTSLPGVKKVVRVGDYAVAVVADTWWHATKALDALNVDWDLGAGANASSASFAETIKAGLDAEQAAVGNQSGDAKGALAQAARKVEAVYAYPHQNHATMEPMNATARWTAEGCEVWTPPQNGEAALAATAEAAGLPPAKCEVYKLPLGGGFGRRGAVHDRVRQAVAIARELPGTHVKLLWSREEDMTHGQYHPVTQCKLTAGFDAQGDLTAMHMRISGQSILAGIFPQNIRDGRDPVVFQGQNNDGGEAMFGYTVPNLLIDHAMRNPHVPPSFWRGVNLNQNAIYVECFIDEIAHATQQDPLELRRKLIADPKRLALLNAAAERVGWAKPAPDVNGQKVFRRQRRPHAAARHHPPLRVPLRQRAGVRCRPAPGDRGQPLPVVLRAGQRRRRVQLRLDRRRRLRAPREREPTPA